MDLAHPIVLCTYVAMALELRFIAVPSVVSTRQRLRRAQDSSPAAKLALAAPIVLIDVLFLIPPVLVFAPGLIAYLGPIPQLAAPAVRWAGVALVVFGKLLPPLSLPPLRRALDRGCSRARASSPTRAIRAWSACSRSISATRWCFRAPC